MAENQWNVGNLVRAGWNGENTLGLIDHKNFVVHSVAIFIISLHSRKRSYVWA